MRFHTFYTTDLPKELIQSHQDVCKHVGIDVEYHTTDFTTYDEIYAYHGNLMTSILKEEKEIACFLDIDCLPYNKKYLEYYYNWAKENVSFVGNAQNIFHTKMVNHLYAAASCLMISKKGWQILGSPNLSYFHQNEVQIDTAQILSLRADQMGLPYRLMYPIGYDEEDKNSTQGYWELGTYGKYGIGTVYPATYHYFRMSRFKSCVPSLWKRRVSDILENRLLIPNYTSLPYV